MKGKKPTKDEKKEREKYENICERLWAEDSERIGIGPNGEKILEFEEVDIALVDGELRLVGEGLEDYKHLQSYLKDSATYSFNELTKEWSITIQKGEEGE